MGNKKIVPRQKLFRGDRLRGLRLQDEYSQYELGDLTKVGRTQIVNLESCKHQPSIPTLIRLCEIFEVSADYLLGLSKYPGRMEDDIDDYSHESIGLIG